MNAILVTALVLFFVGGLIAWLGDRLGTFIGKKRHTLFGLRPRHTAMLGTILSGGLIACLTLALLLFYGDSVRFALLHGNQIRRDNTELTARNIGLTRQNQRMETQIAADQAQTKDWQQKANAAIQAAQASQTQARASAAGAKNVQARLIALSGKLTAAQTRIQTSQNAVTNAQANLQTKQQQLAGLNKNLTGTRQQMRNAQAGVRQARGRLASAQRELQAAQTSVAEARAVAVRLATQITDQTGALNTLRDDDVLYRKGQEVGRRVIATNQPMPVIRQALTAFLTDLETQVEQQGGAASSAQTPNGALALSSGGEEVLDGLARSIASQNGVVPSVVIVATAKYNTPKHEQVKIDIQPYNNVLVFPKGTAIASSPISGAQPDDAILSALQNFLSRRVRGAALAQNIIPLVDPRTGEKSVGEPQGIDGETSLALARQIRALGADARVTAYASEDIYSSGPLRLRLSVMPGVSDGLPVASPRRSDPLPQAAGQ